MPGAQISGELFQHFWPARDQKQVEAAFGQATRKGFTQSH
jgi:hypothetical protein